MEGTGCTDGAASPGMVETPVSLTDVLTVVFVVVVIFVGCCFCVKSLITFDLLGLVDFFVAIAFLLGAISRVDGDRKGEEEEVSTCKNKREIERKRAEREIECSNDRDILGKKIIGFIVLHKS